MQCQKCIFLLRQMLSLMSAINPGDYYVSVRLFKFETLEKVQAGAFTSTCKLENLKIVRNEHRHTKTTDDEAVF